MPKKMKRLNILKTLAKIRYEEYVLLFLAGLGAFVFIAVYINRDYAWIGALIALVLISLIRIRR
ncbi:MAG: hypothetical protein KAT43_04515 [Nanoarchaeota archaeon]|nr:hypothetical protein [Nanoarchaeota archaeon]